MSCEAESDDHWSYDDWSVWHEHFPAAAGLSQSPIDIQIKQTEHKWFPLFEFSPDYMQPVRLTLTNSGHQVAATLEKTSGNTHEIDLHVHGGGLDGVFHFVNFHLHWGQNDRHGSEHEINGREYPAEAHFVHKNRQTGQIAVFAFFFFITQSIEEENPEWKKYSTVASRLTHIGDTDNCVFDLSHLMNINCKRFFRYEGSLTTPPCSEGVIWTIFLDKIPILEEDLDLLRLNILRKVYRPVQRVNNRIIHRNFDEK